MLYTIVDKRTGHVVASTEHDLIISKIVDLLKSTEVAECYQVEKYTFRKVYRSDLATWPEGGKQCEELND